MSNIVFILGAGASYQAGAPLMGNFLDVASDLLRSGAVRDKTTEFQRVFEAIGALQVVHSKSQLDLNNIESIFTVLELGKIIQRVPGICPDEIDNTIAALKELIVKTLEVTMKFPLRDSYVGVPKPYEAFASLLRHLKVDSFPKQSASVISFNYDIGVDMGIFRCDLGPDYVIGNQNFHPSHSSVQLLKLHGSLNWATEIGSRNIIPVSLRDYFNRFNYRLSESGDVRVEIGSNLQKYFGLSNQIQVDPEPVIVPPSWNKADYHAALSEVWAAAAKHLSEAEHIFVIGYSLPETDSFFRHLYALGSVGNSPLRRFEVFNPDTSGATDKRFLGLLGPGAAARYKYHPVTFEEAIKIIKGYFPKDTR